MMKRTNVFALFLSMLMAACATTTPLVQPAIPSALTSTAIEPTRAPTLEATSTPDQTTPEIAPVETGANPPPEPIPAPNNSPQPAAPPHDRPGTAIKLDSIRMVDASNGWAIRGADILITSDGGQTWREVTPPQQLPAASRNQAQGFFLDRLTAWIIFSSDDQVPPEAMVWRTTNGGQTWNASTPLHHEAYGDQVWGEFSALDTEHAWLMIRGVYAGAGIHYAAQFFRTTDGGSTWLPLTGDVGNDYTGLAFADANHGLLTWQTTGAYAPAPPQYAVTTDGAVNWDVRDLPPPPDAPDLFDNSPYCESFQPHMLSDQSMRLWVGCFDEYDPPHVFSSYLYASEDGGATWTSLLLPANILASQAAVFFFDKEDFLLLDREIYHSTDGGRSWELIKSVNWDGWFTFVDPQTGWAIARANDQTALVKTSNGGATWSEIKPAIAP